MSAVDSDASAMVAYFSHHLVSLAWTDCPLSESGVEQVDDVREYCTSGFVMSWQDAWFWVTAGHVIEEINKAMANPRQKMWNVRLIDSFGTGADFNEPIPFPYEPEAAMCVNARGMDFGLVYLRPLYREMLKRNGIVPVAEENWRSQPRIKCDAYWMLGIPEAGVRDGTILTRMRPVDALVDPMADAFDMKYPQFVGRIITDEKPSEIESIVGMSGGPIFGFRKDDDGLRCWIVAVQSGWLKSELVVYGCNVCLLGALVEEFHEQVGLPEAG